MSVRKKLIEFWEQATDKVSAERAAKSLQRQAEIDVASAQESYESAGADFDKAKMDAKDDSKKGFQKIVETHRKMLVEKKKFEDSISIYEALFGEKPRLLE